MNAAESKYRKTLREFPAAGGGVHGHILRCANHAVRAGLNLDTVEDEIHRAMPRSPSPTNEVRKALSKAAAEKGLKWSGTSGEVKDDPEKVRQAAVQAVTDLAGAPMPMEALSKTSPVQIPADSRLWAPLLFSRLFLPRDPVFCGDLRETVSGVCPAVDWIKTFVSRRPLPPFFCPNPLTGHRAPTKGGGLSLRCDAAVARHRHVVFESDIVPLETQSSFLAGRIAAGWPVVSVVYSGGKSLHALLRVDCPDARAWEQNIRGTLFPQLVSLGADRACANPSRMTRLPGSVRHETGNVQGLLWLAKGEAA